MVIFHPPLAEFQWQPCLTLVLFSPLNFLFVFVWVTYTPTTTFHINMINMRTLTPKVFPIFDRKGQSYNMYRHKKYFIQYHDKKYFSPFFVPSFYVWRERIQFDFSFSSSGWFFLIIKSDQEAKLTLAKFFFYAYLPTDWVSVILSNFFFVCEPIFL